MYPPQPKSVGLIVNDIANPFYGELVQAANERTRELDYELVVYPVNDDLESALRAIDNCVRNGVRGAAAFLCSQVKAEIPRFAERGLPMIIHNCKSEFPKIKNFGVPLRTAGEMAADHLVAIGRQSLAIIQSVEGIDDRSTFFLERARVLNKPVHPALQRQNDQTTLGGYNAAIELLDSGHVFDAVFVFNDNMAIGAMEALHERGVEIPYQCAVLGCDGIPQSAVVRPPLSTLCLNPAGIGVKSIDYLLAVIEGKDGCGSFQADPPRLIVRESTDTGYAEISKRLPALGRLAGAIVHDFNNSLAVAIGFVDILTNKIDEESNLFKLGSSTTNTLVRCQILARQLTNMFNKPRSPSPTLVSDFLSDAVKELSLAVMGSHNVVYEPGEASGYIMIDPPMIESVLLNLTINASQAASSGTITISDRPAAVLPPALASRQASGYWIIDVADDGPGIPLEYRSFVFDPFFTKREGGSGLGLALVRSIISFTSGYVELVDTKVGACFRLYLPVSTAPGGAKEIPAVLSFESSRPKIVIVEDQVELNEIISLLLSSMNCETASFNSAESFLDAIGKGLKFDVLVTDLLLSGLSGASIAREVRKMHKNFPIVYMTGAASQFKGELLNDEFTALLHKPIRREELNIILELNEKYKQYQDAQRQLGRHVD